MTLLYSLLEGNLFEEDLNSIYDLLDQNRHLVNIKNPKNNETFLHLAVMRCQIGLINRLKEFEAPLNCCDNVTLQPKDYLNSIDDHLDRKIASHVLYRDYIRK